MPLWWPAGVGGPQGLALDTQTPGAPHKGLLWGSPLGIWGFLSGRPMHLAHKLHTPHLARPSLSCPVFLPGPNCAWGCGAEPLFPLFLLGNSSKVLGCGPNPALGIGVTSGGLFGAGHGARVAASRACAGPQLLWRPPPVFCGLLRSEFWVPHWCYLTPCSYWRMF